MEEKGEYAVGEPYYNMHEGILYANNVCMLRAHFRNDLMNEKTLAAMQGLDIIPAGKENARDEE